MLGSRRSRPRRRKRASTIPRPHHDPEYTLQITDIRWIVLHVIEETATHSGHLEIARELLDGKTRLGGR
jgi:hypothetical protein